MFCTIQWIAIYLKDNAICSLNNWSQHFVTLNKRHICITNADKLTQREQQMDKDL